jgi:hypothetical protein
MTDPEIRGWMKLLPKPVKGTIIDLLTHAGEDEMSDEDKEVCHRALEMIEQDEWSYGSGPGTLAGDEDL